MEFAPQTRVEISREVVSRILGDEVVMLDLTSGQYMGLDPVGSRIWELISEKGTFGRILESVIHEYEVDPEQARSDLIRLLQELARSGLIRFRNED